LADNQKSLKKKYRSIFLATGLYSLALSLYAGLSRYASDNWTVQQQGGQSLLLFGLPLALVVAASAISAWPLLLRKDLGHWFLFVVSVFSMTAILFGSIFILNFIYFNPLTF
jgi:hypothetical protein